MPPCQCVRSAASGLLHGGPGRGAPLGPEPFVPGAVAGDDCSHTIPRHVNQAAAQPEPGRASTPCSSARTSRYTSRGVIEGGVDEPVPDRVVVRGRVAASRPQPPARTIPCAVQATRPVSRTIRSAPQCRVRRSAAARLRRPARVRFGEGCDRVDRSCVPATTSARNRSPPVRTALATTWGRAAVASIDPTVHHRRGDPPGSSARSRRVLDHVPRALRCLV